MSISLAEPRSTSLGQVDFLRNLAPTILLADFIEFFPSFGLTKVVTDLV
jgi:hypothetical protein